MVGVAVGAVETHSAEGVARNGSRHDGNLHLPHHASRRAQSMLDAPALSILGNGVFQAAPGEDWGDIKDARSQRPSTFCLPVPQTAAFLYSLVITQFVHSANETEG